MEPLSAGHRDRREHTAAQLALLRAGEQSVRDAFGGILRRMTPGERSVAALPLTRLIFDEERHDAGRAIHAGILPHTNANDARTWRFFRDLESREPSVHLARVATLDASVCQVLASVLRPPTGQYHGESLFELLGAIRPRARARRFRTQVAATHSAAHTPISIATTVNVTMYRAADAVRPAIADRQRSETGQGQASSRTDRIVSYSSSFRIDDPTSRRGIRN